jgi:hypothetical protein
VRPTSSHPCCPFRVFSLFRGPSLPFLAPHLQPPLPAGPSFFVHFVPFCSSAWLRFPNEPRPALRHDRCGRINPVFHPLPSLPPPFAFCVQCSVFSVQCSVFSVQRSAFRICNRPFQQVLPSSFTSFPFVQVRGCAFPTNLAPRSVTTATAGSTPFSTRCPHCLPLSRPVFNVPRSAFATAPSRGSFFLCSLCSVQICVHSRPFAVLRSFRYLLFKCVAALSQ